MKLKVIEAVVFKEEGGREWRESGFWLRKPGWGWS